MQVARPFFVGKRKIDVFLERACNDDLSAYNARLLTG